MKLQTLIDPTESGAHIYVAGEGEDPSWLYLRWREEDNGFWGCFARPGNTGLAIGRPVRIEGLEALAPSTIGSFAHGVFLIASGMRAVPEGTQIVDERASQLDAWDAFLSGGKAQKAEKKTIDAIEFGQEQIQLLRTNRFLDTRRGASLELLVRRDHPLKIGRPMSGFEMHMLQRAIHKKLPAVPAPPDLDLERAKQALSGAPRPSSTAVSWFGEKCENANDRLQVAQVYPILSSMIADIPALRQAVDRRDPIQDKLIEATGLSKGAFKRLSKVRKAPAAESLFEAQEAVAGEDAIGVLRVRRHRVDGGASLNEILRHLANMPPDRCPQDEESWGIFQDILTKVAIPLENGIGLPVAKTLAGCKGDWKQFHAQLAKAADFEPEAFGPRTMALTTIDAIEAIEDMAIYAVMPLMLSSIEDEDQEMPTIEREYFLDALAISTNAALGKSKNPAPGLMEMARRYASRIPALLHASGAADPAVLEDQCSRMDRRLEEIKSAYYPLVEPFVASNGLMVVNLLSDQEMELESERLSHCVGRYYLGSARETRCHILSVQSADRSRSFATIEVSGIDAPQLSEANDLIVRPRVVQFRARGNAEPAADAKLALEEWKTACAEGRVQLATPLAVIEQWRRDIEEHRRVQFGPRAGQAPRTITWGSVLGFDWKEEERRAALWTECAYVMGSDWGKANNPGVIWRDARARKLLGAMSPQTAAALEQRAREAKAAPRDAEPADPTP